MMLILALLALFLAQHALAESGSNLYAPRYVQCPSGSMVREANGLSELEQAFRETRHRETNKNLRNFLQITAKLESLEYEPLLAKYDIGIGLGFSGGGYRAMLAGAGQLSALDNRTTGASEHGLGGLLDLATYISGLSGGLWLVGTLTLTDWNSVEAIISQNEVWDLENPIYAPAGLDLITGAEYWSSWIQDVDEKCNAGFETSLIDLWGRALLQFLLPELNDHGVSKTWSSIAESRLFQEGKIPLPIVLADCQIGLEPVEQTKLTVFEINALEFGLWDTSINAFVPTKYVGTNLTSGEPENNVSCVEGFDNGGFVMGSSLALFNAPIDDLAEDFDKVLILRKILDSTIEDTNVEPLVHADYPNPFYGSSFGSLQELATTKRLGLVDGGDDDEVVPVLPLIVESRGLDFISLYDNSNDVNGWPNGLSLVTTYKRQFSEIGKAYSFPPVPSTEEFLAKGLTKKPVFFGCNASALSDLAFIPPVVMYTANSEYSHLSNTSTFKLSYSQSDKLKMIRNGFETATRNNLTDDSGFATCVGCAVIRRAQEREGIAQSEVCRKCFEEYCYF